MRYELGSKMQRGARRNNNERDILENGNYRFSFILACLKEYAVNFSSIDSLKFNAISQKKYHFEHKKFKLS